MAPRLFACFGRGFSSPAAGAETADEGAENRRMGPILVELFSSQGCKASPEAEQLVGRLGRGDVSAAGAAEDDGGPTMPEVVVLGFHVEYWDYMGWKDPFGFSSWTVRQKAYVDSLRLDTLYTPQVVVQGRKECLGTEEDSILSAVRAAPRFPQPTFQITCQRPSPDSLQVHLIGQLRAKIDGGGVEVMVVLYENGLVTNCEKGENSGRVLSNNFVVRRMEKLCSIKDVSPKKNLSGQVNFSLWEGFNSSKCGVVVFAQNSSSQIFGVQQFNLPDTL